MDSLTFIGELFVFDVGIYLGGVFVAMNKASVLVPLRLNSKSIPKKNIRPLAGKPMCAWVLEAACSSSRVGQVVVSTESQEIMDVISSLGLPIDFVRRPDELAGDKSTTESVMQNALSACKHETLVLIQATSPLLSTADIDRALDLFSTGGFDSVLSAVRTKAFFWRENGTPLNYDPLNRPMRQDFPGCFQENGAIYITTQKAFVSSGCRISGKIGVYEVEPDKAVELDEPHDWEYVERVLACRGVDPSDTSSSPKNVKVLVCDVDGTLTDGGMYYGPSGEVMKKFNTRDAVGLAQLRRRGVDVIVVTSEDSPSVAARMKKLEIGHYYPNVSDKEAFLDQFLVSAGYSWDDVGYIGDDLNDVAAMRKASWVACPADACAEVQKLASHSCKMRGGEGAVREACDYLLSWLNVRG